MQRFSGYTAYAPAPRACPQGNPYLPAYPSPQRTIGVVKSFNAREGFGFIESPLLKAQYGRDVFVHKKQIKFFGVGARVSFDFKLNQRNWPQAWGLQLPTELEERFFAWAWHCHTQVVARPLENVDVTESNALPVNLSDCSETVCVEGIASANGEALPVEFSEARRVDALLTEIASQLAVKASHLQLVLGSEVLSADTLVKGGGEATAAVLVVERPLHDAVEAIDKHVALFGEKDGSDRRCSVEHEYFLLLQGPYKPQHDAASNTVTARVAHSVRIEHDEGYYYRNSTYILDAVYDCTTEKVTFENEESIDDIDDKDARMIREHPASVGRKLRTMSKNLT